MVCRDVGTGTGKLTRTNKLMYHQVGASGYFLISFMWMSSSSVLEFFHWAQIILPWCRYVYTMREAIAANDRP